MRDPNPTVVLIPGLGMIAWGKNKSESRVTAEFYNCAIEVMRGAEAIDEYEAMDQQEAFDIEYWLLEEAKLQRHAAGEGTRPPDPSSSSAPARASARKPPTGSSRKARTSSASIVDEAAAKATADEIIAKYGAGIGVAGTRHLATAAPAIGLGCDITDREVVAQHARERHARLRRLRRRRS